MGRSETLSLGELRQRLGRSRRATGSLSLEAVVGDVADLHADVSNAKGLFQAASQFNLRMNHSGPFEAQTPGIGMFFVISRQDDDWHYRMRAVVREAIEDIPGLQEAVTWPLEKIQKTYRESWWSDHAAQREQLAKQE